MFSDSLPLGSMGGPGLRKDLGTFRARIPGAAPQGYPATAMRLPKEHPCLLLHPSGLSQGLKSTHHLFAEHLGGCTTAALARGVGVPAGQESPGWWGHAEVTRCKHWGTPWCCRSSLHTLSPQTAAAFLCQCATPSPTQGCQGWLIWIFMGSGRAITS